MARMITVSPTVSPDVTPAMMLRICLPALRVVVAIHLCCTLARIVSTGYGKPATHWQDITHAWHYCHVHARAPMAPYMAPMPCPMPYPCTPVHACPVCTP